MVASGVLFQKSVEMVRDGPILAELVIRVEAGSRISWSVGDA